MDSNNTSSARYEGGEQQIDMKLLHRAINWNVFELQAALVMSIEPDLKNQTDSVVDNKVIFTFYFFNFFISLNVYYYCHD